MSTGGAQVAVFGMRGRMVPERVAGVEPERTPVIRLAAFAVLGLYGVGRWSTLLSGGTHGRLLGLLGLGLLLAVGRPILAARSRPAAVVFTVLILLAAFPVAGVPLSWVRHMRIAVTARAIGAGLSALPQALVPYRGLNPWVRLDMTLGGGVLLLDAALFMAFAPGRMSDIRKAGAALPLVALIAVPSTLTHPRSPYLDGLLLFLMLAALALGDRIGSRQASGALGLCLITAIIAMLIAPALSRKNPWVNYWSLAGGLAPKVVEVFNWSQTYGPVDWPQHGRTVLEVSASHPTYWKTEDLDVFDGGGWTQGTVPGQNSTPSPSRAALARWSQTIQVTIDDMKSTDVIGAGISSQPSHPFSSGYSPGTWTTVAGPLEPGDSYTLRVYAPQPSPGQLRAAGRDYAGLPPGYRTLMFPPEVLTGGDASEQVVFAPFHSRTPIQSVVGGSVVSAPAILQASPYAEAYGLAQRLAHGMSTPYAFVLAVARFLAHGYTYSQDPPVRSYPLESFLFADKRGYCQQFAGAMALLLRMGGVPARVAVGFTQGYKDAATGHWIVTDRDAHAWVEVWFPRYGWVRFDPTPAADPAFSELSPITNASTGGISTAPGSGQKAAGGFRNTARHGVDANGLVRRSAGVAVAAIAAPAGALALLALIVVLVLTRPLGSVEARVAELERALGRSGRSVNPGVTLARLEHAFRDSPGASGYIRALRQERFGAGHAPPTRAERRALRRRLARRSGPLGRARILWTLPPRRDPARPDRDATRPALPPGA